MSSKPAFRWIQGLQALLNMLRRNLDVHAVEVKKMLSICGESYRLLYSLFGAGANKREVILGRSFYPFSLFFSFAWFCV
jgi:hypothetical protein